MSTIRFMPGCVMFFLGQLGRQCMCVGWVFDSNQNVTVIADCQFISTWSSNTITLSFSTVSRTQKHKYKFWGNWIFGITTKIENKSKMSFNKIRTQPTKHYWKKHRKFKNTAYHLHTASNICKIKFGMYKQK